MKKFRKKLGKIKLRLLISYDKIREFFLKLSGQKVVRCYFSREKNFGDLFNYDLVGYFGNRLIYENNPNKSEMLLTGSILHKISSDFKGYILGSGFIKKELNCRINNWNIRIIRGPLSAKQSGVDPNTICLGDPGILAPMIYSEIVQKSKRKKKYVLGILPHYIDRPFMNNFIFGFNVKVIDVRNRPSKVLKEMLECENIASSSLHGLIFADAFRIPNVHVVFGERIIGGLHKFNDYYLGMNAKPEYLVWEQKPNINQIISNCKLRYTSDLLHHKQREMIKILHEVLKN